MDWPNLTDTDQERLEEAIDLGEEFREKLLIFRSGLIDQKYRWLQLEAHKIYDSLSVRELEVFKMRTRQIHFRR